ncbi:MAG: amino acid ABC transporter substrate-binding protein, partial [Chitinimonas sp.]|nr:amino acid ABC transporter substrate-binding protein [Chitinimonas sp.]
KVADDTLAAIFKSGQINTIYNKWFMTPIPPKNININLPMSDKLKEAIKTPTDAGI